jgi:hypothetical protein|nr:MAG TPA: tail tube protein [Caudoviricetes sp.]
MFLLSRDTVNGAEGKIIVTVNGKQTEIAGMRNITTNAEIQGQDMRVIGTRVIQNKPNGAKQTGTGNIYYGSNIFLDMVLEYINTGHMPEFDIQISNTDPTTSIGSQVMAFYGCQLTGTIPLSVLNNEESMLNYDFNFTFTRVARLASFTEPSSYGS